MKLPLLTPEAKLAEIKRLYYQTTRRSIRDDFARALQLITSMETDEERERAAVYMDGLSQMRSEWNSKKKSGKEKVKVKS